MFKKQDIFSFMYRNRIRLTKNEVSQKTRVDFDRRPCLPFDDAADTEAVNAKNYVAANTDAADGRCSW